MGTNYELFSVNSQIGDLNFLSSNDLMALHATDAFTTLLLAWLSYSLEGTNGDDLKELRDFEVYKGASFG